MELRMQDVRTESFSAGGPMRATHLPTGVVVEIEPKPRELRYKARVRLFEKLREAVEQRSR